LFYNCKYLELLEKFIERDFNINLAKLLRYGGEELETNIAFFRDERQ